MQLTYSGPQHQQQQDNQSKWNSPLNFVFAFTPLITAFAHWNDEGEKEDVVASGVVNLSPERLAAIKSLNVISQVVKEVSPAVVSITATG